MNRTIIGLKRANTCSNVATVGTSSGGGSGSSALEEQLDEAIYYCLNVLTKRHPPSEQFRDVFEKGMFIKPNTKAFFHVVHFLLGTVYDPKEFRKRFYWPIFDKHAESAFRSSTVEYVNALVDRGKLMDMERIKAHMVVLPGGVKFMKFLLALIRFVMREELRKSGRPTNGKVITKADLPVILAYHQRWEQMGIKLRGIIQQDVSVIQARFAALDELMNETGGGRLFEGCSNGGPVRQMSFEKLIALWMTLNKASFRETEERRKRLLDVIGQYRTLMATAKKKLEPKELPLDIAADDLKALLTRLEVASGERDDCRLYREVFDEREKIDAVKLFEIMAQVLPEIKRQLAAFSVRSLESLKFEEKELSKVAVKADSICHEFGYLRRNLPFAEMKFQEDKEGEAKDDDHAAIRSKIFSTPPISMNFDSNGRAKTFGNGNRECGRSRIALLDDEQIHQMNFRMRMLSGGAMYPSHSKTPRSAKKQQQQKNEVFRSPGDVFLAPKPPLNTLGAIPNNRKINPLSLLNKITAQGKSKPNLQPPPQTVNSTLNISSLSTLGDISLRPEFSSTLLGTPEKQQQHSEDSNRRSMDQVCQVNSSPCIPEESPLSLPPRTVNEGISPEAFLLNAARKASDRRRSSLLQLEQLQTSPSGKLEPLVRTGKLAPSRLSEDEELHVGEAAQHTLSPRIIVTDFHDGEERGGVGNVNGAEVSSLVGDEDLSNTLVNEALSQFQQLTLISETVVTSPQKTSSEENLFNISDGILTDFD